MKILSFYVDPVTFKNYISVAKSAGRHHLQDVLATLEKQKPITLDNKQGSVQEQSVILPVLVFSCNRPDIRRSLDGLLKYRPDAKKFPIIVSQDCAHSATAEIIRSYASQVTYIQVITLQQAQFYIIKTL